MAAGGRMGRFGGGLADKKGKDEQQLTKITRDSSKLAVDQVKGMSSQARPLIPSSEVLQPNRIKIPPSWPADRCSQASLNVIGYDTRVSLQVLAQQCLGVMLGNPVYGLHHKVTEP